MRVSLSLSSLLSPLVTKASAVELLRDWSFSPPPANCHCTLLRNYFRSLAGGWENNTAVYLRFHDLKRFKRILFLEITFIYTACLIHTLYYVFIKY